MESDIKLTRLEPNLELQIPRELQLICEFYESIKN